MFKLNKEGIAVDADDGRPVAVHVDSFVTATGAGSQAATVIMRLYHKDRPTGQAHQFALTAHRAAALGRHLLEVAAQIEKEQSGPQAH